MSIAALAINPILIFFFRHFYRALDYLQMCFLFAISMAPLSFSSHLNTVMLEFDKTFFTSCIPGDFACSNGFRLSFGLVVEQLIIVSFIFVMLQKICGRSIEYEPVFNVLKGFIRWFYLPLVYYCTYELIKQYKTTPRDKNNFIAPGLILIGLVIFPFIQLIGYKCIQKEDTPPATKWMEWLGYLRLISTGGLTAFYTYFLDTVYLKCIFVVLGVYAFFYLIFG